jgi:hypothetical protein
MYGLCYLLMADSTDVGLSPSGAFLTVGGSSNSSFQGCCPFGKYFWVPGFSLFHLIECALLETIMTDR